jgi:ABC-type transport system involved in multi-copper enzyme maturation permease subunit
MTSRWDLWSRQIDAIVRLEIRRHLLGRRWIAIYLLILAPIGLLTLRALFAPPRALNVSAQNLNLIYAGFFQAFMLRLAILFSCMTIFSQILRGEILEKTLHYYLLSPVRREVIAIGKYMAGLLVVSTLFVICVFGTYLLLFLPSRTATDFIASGAAIPHLARYLIVAILACLGYGAVFLLVGLYVRNPVVPALAILAWETFNFVLPSMLQKVSVIHYLNNLCPVPLPKSPFAVLTEATSPFISIPGLLIFTAVILFLASSKIRRTEITYSAD